MEERKNPLCVISKEGNENGWHDLQDNSAWSANPYGDAFAVVPDHLYESIWETRGFCDIELSEDGTEVVSFTALPIPEIPEPEAEPTQEERIAELEAQNMMLMDCLLEMSEIVYA